MNQQLPYVVVNQNQGDNKKVANTKLKPLPGKNHKIFNAFSKTHQPIKEYAIDINFMDLENQEVAEVLTRIDADMMRKISRGEFLCKEFENLKKDQPNSNYIKYAERLRKVKKKKIIVQKKIKLFCF